MVNRTYKNLGPEPLVWIICEGEVLKRFRLARMLKKLEERYLICWTEPFFDTKKKLNFTPYIRRTHKNIYLSWALIWKNIVCGEKSWTSKTWCPFSITSRSKELSGIGEDVIFYPTRKINLSLLLGGEIKNAFFPCPNLSLTSLALSVTSFDLYAFE